MQIPEQKLLETLINGLKANIKGQVVLHDDVDYNNVRTAWHHLTEKRPTVIIKCVCVEDVAFVSQTARATDMILSMRDSRVEEGFPQIALTLRQIKLVNHRKYER